MAGSGSSSAYSGIVIGTWKMKYHSLMGFFLMALVFAAFYLFEDSRTVLEAQTTLKNSLQSCNLFSGKWVFDNKSRPLYKEQECSFMIGDFSCEKYGRKDLKYQYWRWQPHDCDLPRFLSLFLSVFFFWQYFEVSLLIPIMLLLRFNAKALLKKLTNKRLVFVGDSLNKNQWISMLCLLDSGISPLFNKTTVWKRSLITYQAIVRQICFWICSLFITYLTVINLWIQ